MLKSQCSRCVNFRCLTSEWLQTSIQRVLVICTKTQRAKLNGNKMLALSPSHSSSAAGTTPNLLSISHSVHPSLYEQNPEILRLLHLGQELSPQQEGIIHHFQTFTNLMQVPFQHPGVNFPSESEQCDTPVIGAHPMVPFREDGNRHPSLLL